MAGRRTGGLGKGLDALIPNKAGGPSKEPAKKTRSAVVKKDKPTEKDNPAAERLVKISSVEPNLNQPRRHFDEDALLELSESIKQYGVLQPLLVSDKKDYFEIIAGERRWRAAKMAGLKEVPVVVKEFTDQEIVEISLIENIQREDLNPIEEAMAYKRLMEEFHLKQDEIADRVAKSRTAVTNSMRLLKLSSKVQEMVIADMISAGHARALLGISDEALQETTAMKVFDEKLSVRETEKLVKNPEEEGVTLAYIRLTKDFEEIKEYVQHEMDEIALFLKRRKMMINQLWKDTMHMERVSLVMVT